MKQTDIDRLKEICEKEGFNFDWDHVDHSAIIVREKKDPWDGVEFVECVKDNGHGFYFKNKIYPVQYISNSILSIYGENRRLIEGIQNYKDSIFGNTFKPSAESAYIEQLKKEAFERYGEIKDGDRFDRSGIDINWPTEKMYDSELGFTYKKSDDILYFGGLGIYQSGKWAKKLPERVKVVFQGSSIADYGFNSYSYAFEVRNIATLKHEEIGKYLAKSLEQYLNKEQ